MAGTSTARVRRGQPRAGDPRANALRVLAIDGGQADNSGRPGAPMGTAEMAVAPGTRHPTHGPADPRGPERDCFGESARAVGVSLAFGLTAAALAALVRDTLGVAAGAQALPA
jgi:hypothetical protein